MAAPPRRTYDEAEKKAALELGAALGRNAAVRELGISKSTFQKWTDQYPDFWSDLRAADPQVQKMRFAQRLDDLAERYIGAEHDLLDRIEDQLIKRANAKEAAALVKALGSSRMAATAGARQVVPEAEVHEHHIDFPQLEQALVRVLERAPEPIQVPNEAVKELDGGEA